MAVQQTTTQTILPEWYTQYAQNLTGKAMAAAEEPYQAYGLPRIAGFQPEQEQAFAMAPGKAAAYQPYLEDAGTLATAGGTGSSYNAAAPLIAKGATSFTAPGVASQYMNPYIQSVVSGIGDIAARNLREKILPEVNRTFIGGGTFGGSRSAEFTNRAIRDANASALSQQVQALQQGYNQAAELQGAEAARALTAGQTTGTLAGSDYNRMLEASKGLGALGTAAQELGLREASTLEGIGAARQGLAQKSADLAYQDFQAQREYPWTQLQRMSSVAGTPSGTGGTTVTNAPGPSTGSQIIGALGGIAGILGSAGVFKEGGKVKKAKAGLGWLKDKK
jgi:hypothetical protein